MCGALARADCHQACAGTPSQPEQHLSASAKAGITKSQSDFVLSERSLLPFLSFAPRLAEGTKINVFGPVARFLSYLACETTPVPASLFSKCNGLPFPATSKIKEDHIYYKWT
ncbi:hypothetical protein TRVL_05582 [Trypanosoma vivax]|nr:hypothetical protein TRVL_05582 [Trypanosoma vivax]